LPVSIASDDTLTINVMIGIPVSYLGELLQDTIFIQTAEDEFSALIMVDSVLVQGKPELTAENKIKIYPNPFYSDLQIAFNLKNAAVVNFELYDLSGRKYYSSKSQFPTGKNELIIDAKKLGLKPGTYIYWLNSNARTYTGKVIYRP
jgi:hypothetical protein